MRGAVRYCQNLFDTPPRHSLQSRMTEGARLPLTAALCSLEKAARHVLLGDIRVELYHLRPLLAFTVFAFVSVLHPAAPAQPGGLFYLSS